MSTGVTLYRSLEMVFSESSYLQFSSTKMNVYDLKSNQELRFQVGDEPIKLELKRGLAEVQGTEMLLNKTYTFPRKSRSAVFTYHGASIEVVGEPAKCRVGQGGDYMIRYLTIHGDLERMRDEAERISEHANFSGTSPVETATENESTDTNTDKAEPDLSRTPICLVCEPADTRNLGKSTLCRILLNYATRRGRVPIFVDLDPDQNIVGLPGTVGAISIESPIDIENGLSLGSAMLMHFGHTNSSGGEEGEKGFLYKSLIDNIAKVVRSKLRQDKKSYYSGVIINTAACPNDDEYKRCVLSACLAFKANVVLVMDDEELQYELTKDLSDCKHSVNVLNVPKTVGTRLPEVNAESKFLKIREYFYGSQQSYNPMTSELKFSILKRLIYQVGNALILHEAMMPLGAKSTKQQVQVTPMECKASDLLNHILAVSYCKIDDIVEDPESVMRMNIMGFICITSIKNDGETVCILTPQKLPNPMNNVLLFSEIQYMDSLI